METYTLMTKQSHGTDRQGSIPRQCTKFGYSISHHIHNNPGVYPVYYPKDIRDSFPMSKDVRSLEQSPSLHPVLWLCLTSVPPYTFMGRC